MRFRTLFSICLFCICASVQAQVISQETRYISDIAKFKYIGQIVDSADYTPLPRAVIHLVTKLPSGLMSQWIVCDTLGRFDFEMTSSSQSRIEISMLGYKLKTIYLDKTAPMRNFGKIPLSPDPMNIDEATVKARQRLSYLVGDTLRIVASAVKTMKGDALIDILRQIPELSINEDGSVSYKDEVITNVTVNNKKIFGNDNIAPYYLLAAKDAAYIDVFDEEDEREKRTTLGEVRKRKRMNIFTIEDFDHYTAGSFIAESGVNGKNSEQRELNDRYAFGGGIGLYSESRQLVLESAISNINQGSAFYSPANTLLVVGINPAESKYASLSYGIERKNQNKYNVNFRWSDSKTDRSLHRELSYFKQDNYDSQTERSVASNATEANSLNGGFTMTLMSNPKTTFNFSGRLNYSESESTIDRLGEMIRDNVVISSSNSQSKSDMSNYNIPADFRLTHKFNNQNLLSVGGSFNYTNMTKNSAQDVNDVNNSDLNTVTLIDVDSKNPTMNANGSLKYSRNFKELNNKVVDFTAGISYQSADQTKIAYDRVTGEINELYSADQNNRQKQMNIGVGTYLTRNLRFDVSFIRSNIQNEEFDNDVDANFNTIDMSMNFKFWNINANLLKRTQLPQASTLSNKLNVGNPYYLTVGNANLEPVKLYNLTLSRPIKIKKNTVSLSVNARYYTDNIVYRRRYFAESTVLPEYDNYVVNSGASLVMPFNGSDKWELGGSISANKNVLKVGVFRNVFTYGYKRDAEEVDAKMEYSNRHHISHKFEYTSNFSYVFRVSLSNRFNYMYSERTKNISESGLSNEMSIYAVGDLFDRFRIEAAYLMNYYNTPFANRESHTLNARIGMRIFKNKMGIISLNAMDILGNNDQWQTMQTSLGIVSQMSKCLSNYYSISFAYRFNNKK